MLVWDPRPNPPPSFDGIELYDPSPEPAVTHKPRSNSTLDPGPLIQKVEGASSRPNAILEVSPSAPPVSVGVERYGLRFPRGTNDLTIELHCFLHGRSEDQGGLGKFGHLRNCIDILWNRPDSPTKVIWTPWLEQQLRAACEFSYLAVAGAASAGKSMAFALYAIVSYLAAPQSTLVIATSTTLTGARQRIWGAISSLWMAVPGLPGKYVDSHGRIRGVLPTNPNEFGDKTGILLLPSEKKAEKDALGKLVGIKAPRVILIADELPELPESLIHAARSNLSANESFQMIALGNPASYYDAFGIFAQPVDGWGSITEADHEWPILGGQCIRLNGELSPNYLSRRVIYPFMQRFEDIDFIKTTYGERSLYYNRMVKAWFPPEGAENGVYSEADIVRGAASRPCQFSGAAQRVAGLDPSFTAGGDRTIAYFGTIGAVDGLQTLRFDEWVVLKEDPFSKQVPRSVQIARAFIQECRKRGITPSNAAIDSTGGGGPFCDILALEWNSQAFHRVPFGGAPTSRPVSALDPAPARERYANRVTEIWMVGKELLRSYQLRNIAPELGKEMTKRLYSTVKGTNVRLKIESKTDFKSRIGESPDIADAAFVLVDLCRERFGLSANERFEANVRRHQTFAEKLRRWDSIYHQDRTFRFP